MVDGGKRENELLIYMMHNVARLLSDTSHGTSDVLCPSSFCVLYKLLGLFFSHVVTSFWDEVFILRTA